MGAVGRCCLFRMSLGLCLHFRDGGVGMVAVGQLLRVFRDCVDVGNMNKTLPGKNSSIRIPCWTTSPGFWHDSSLTIRVRCSYHHCVCQKKATHANPIHWGADVRRDFFDQRVFNKFVQGSKAL